jgi:hypothetical protein
MKMAPNTYRAILRNSHNPCPTLILDEGKFVESSDDIQQEKDPGDKDFKDTSGATYCRDFVHGKYLSVFR